MAPWIEGRLRTLEREFLKERAELAVYDFVDAVMARWDDVARDRESEYAVLDLIDKLWVTKIGLPTWPAAIDYLSKCQIDGETPNPRHLTTKLAP